MRRVSPVAPVDAFVPEVAVVLAAPEVRVAPSVDDAAAAPDEAFAFRLPSASGERVVVEKSICIVSVRMSVSES